MALPDPALVVLVGPSGSGKSTWAADRYRAEEVVSSDALRGVVGSGPHDLDASDEAFALLETIVAGRLRRAADHGRRHAGHRRRAPAALARPGPRRRAAGGRRRPRHRRRDLPAPQRRARPSGPGPGAGRPAQAARRARRPAGRRGLGRGRDGRHDAHRRRRLAAPRAAPPPRPSAATARGSRSCSSSAGSRGATTRSAWVAGVARAADELGFGGLSLMDHLIQIPQVDRAWSPIPEPWVTLGASPGWAPAWSSAPWSRR